MRLGRQIINLVVLFLAIMKLYQKVLNSPTHSSNPTQAIYPKPFHHITSVECVGYN